MAAKRGETRPREPLRRTDRAWLARVVDEFKTRNWKDDTGSAVAILDLVRSSGGRFDAGRLAEFLPPEFLHRNTASLAAVEQALSRALDGWELEQPLPLLVPIDEIASFARVRDVAAVAAARLKQPLDLPEEFVKRAITTIIGEPYVDRDWGGERSDVFTSRVQMRGTRVPAAFLLKGRGLRGPLTPARLGKQGDQILRLAQEPAQLFIVQHVGSVASSTVEHLRQTIQTLRVDGKPYAVGSVWDGHDVARLLLAHELIDPATGQAVRNRPTGAADYVRGPPLE